MTLPRKGNLWLCPDYPLTVTMHPAKTVGRVVMVIEAPANLADHLQQALDLLWAMSQNLQTRRTQVEMGMHSEEVRREQAAIKDRMTEAYYEYRLSGLLHRAAMRALAGNQTANPSFWPTSLLYHYVPTNKEAAVGLRRLRIQRENRGTEHRPGREEIARPGPVL